MQINWLVIIPRKNANSALQNSVQVALEIIEKTRFFSVIGGFSAVIKALDSGTIHSFYGAGF